MKNDPNKVLEKLLKKFEKAGKKYADDLSLSDLEALIEAKQAVEDMNADMGDEVEAEEKPKKKSKK